MPFPRCCARGYRRCDRDEHLASTRSVYDSRRRQANRFDCRVRHGHSQAVLRGEACPLRCPRPVRRQPHLCSGGGAGLHVYPSPASAGKTAGTQATWYVDGLEAVVDDLIANGVRFEQYDDPPIKTDEKGLAANGTVAWLKDPDGNTLAIEQSTDA